MTEAFQFRDIGPDEAAAYSRFARDIFVATYGPHYPAARLDRHVGAAFSEAAQRQELLDARRTSIGVYTDDGAMAGFVVMHRSDTPPEVVGARPVEVERFYVGEAHHGAGLAMRLMNTALARATANGHDAVWLSVWRDNARAIRFYEKAGFARAGRIEFLFGGEMELDTLMARTLP